MPKKVAIPLSPFPTSLGRTPKLRQAGQHFYRGYSKSKYVSRRNPDLPAPRRLIDRVCDHIASGRLVADVCRCVWAPSQRVWFRWVSEFPEVRRAYDAARRMRVERLRESVLDTAHSLVDGADRESVKVAIKATQWLANRLERDL